MRKKIGLNLKKKTVRFWDLDKFFFSCEVNLYFWKHTQSFKVKQQFKALKLDVGTLCPPRGITRTENPGANRVKLVWAWHSSASACLFVFSFFMLKTKLQVCCLWMTRQMDLLNDSAHFIFKLVFHQYQVVSVTIWYQCWYHYQYWYQYWYRYRYGYRYESYQYEV